METHDRPSGERPEEPQAGTTPEAEPRQGSSATSEVGEVQSWPPPAAQEHTAGPGAEPAAGSGETPPPPEPGTARPGYAPPPGYSPHGYAPHGGPYQAPRPGPFDPPAGASPYGVPMGPYDPQADAEAGGPHPADGWWNARRKVAAGGIALALVVVGGLAGGAVAALVGGGRTTYASPTVVKPAADQGATGVAAIAKAVEPSVVSITVTTQTGGDEGSGVILRSDGVILTNNHVVAAQSAGGGQMSVKFSDGKKAPATVLGTDPATDLAVIKASGVSGRKPATLGESAQLQVGDPVVAIGSPLGLEGSVTSGIVSALHRVLSEGGDRQPQMPGIPGMPGQSGGSGGATIADAIQTDAAINPGNSGGPLVNGSGQVIGINTAIATSGGGNGNIGVGFAIPIDTAKQVADQLIKSGKATHAYLGVSLSDALGDQQGALIAGVQSGTPAASAGLQEGDIITQADGKAVDGAEALSAAVRAHRPGDKMTLTYVRGGQKHTVTVTLASTSG